MKIYVAYTLDALKDGTKKEHELAQESDFETLKDSMRKDEIKCVIYSYDVVENDVYLEGRWMKSDDYLDEEKLEIVFG